MKFNYKKVASIFASAIMLSSTIGFAAAATYPSPFTGGAAVVYGENAATTDMAAAIDIYKDLSSKTTSSSTSSTTAVAGEAAAIETGGQKLYLGDYMNTTKSAFSKTELPTVLSDGKISDEDGTDFTYIQKINTPNTNVVYSKTSDNLAEPILNLNLDSSSINYSMEVTFPTAVNVTKLTNKDITLFGKKYTFSGSASDLTIKKLVLFENAQSQIVKSGESADVTVSEAKHTIAITSVESDVKATITVDGVSQAVTEGNTYKVSGLDLYVKNVIGPNVAGETRAVELYLGSAKVTLEDGNSVVKGSTTVYGTSVAITSSGNKVSKIALTVVPSSLDNRIKYIKENASMTDPIFGTFKVSFGSIEPGLADTARDEIQIKATGEQKAKLKFTNKVGNTYDQEMFKPSSAIALSSLKNATTFGFDSYDVITTTSGEANENDYVITGSNEYSQIWQVTRIDVPNKRVVLRDMAGDSQTISLTDSTVGSTATLSLADSSSATITLVGNTTGGNLNVTVNKATAVVYTKGGAKIDMTALIAPANATTTGGLINITEETAYNDGSYTNNVDGTIGLTPINVTMLYDAATRTGNDMYIYSIAVPDTTSSNGLGTVGDYDTYYLTKYGSVVKYSGNNDKIFDMMYSKSASALKVYIGEIASSITPGSTGTATGAVTIVKDSEIASVSDKNLIVVGGSCINTVAAKILGSDSPLCADDFSAITKVSAGGYIIQTVTSPYNSGKVAMLVAGYNAADTQNAAARAVQSDVSTDVGSQEVYPQVTA
ncbi:MAG: hypothetical protein WC979_09150 [Candidatus Pacearchaeota archaeon]|jgi:hypothetical protein